MYQTHRVLHSKEGFSLEIVEASRFRAIVDSLFDFLCSASGHRFCYLYGKISDWEYRKERVLYTMPISKELAELMTFPKAWDYLEDED